LAAAFLCSMGAQPKQLLDALYLRSPVNESPVASAHPSSYDRQQLNLQHPISRHWRSRIRFEKPFLMSIIFRRLSRVSGPVGHLVDRGNRIRGYIGGCSEEKCLCNPCLLCTLFTQPHRVIRTLTVEFSRFDPLIQDRDHPWMPYRFMCNDVQRKSAKPSPDIAFGLFCYVPLHNIRDDIHPCVLLWA